MRPAKFLFPAVDASAVCAAQTIGGAGSLVINGTLLDLPATMQGVTRAVFGAIERTVALASTADLSAVLFTITGKNLKRETVNESILGPNNNTVYTTATFAEVDSVAVNAAVATAVTIGTGPTGVTNWFVIDQFKNPIQVDLFMMLTGGITVSAQITPDNVQTESSPDILTPNAWQGVITSTAGPLGQSARAVRAAVIGSSGGAMEFTVAQAG